MVSCRQSEVHVPKPILVEGMVGMSREGVAPEEMIKRLWKSQTVCERSAVGVVPLHKDGGHERVIDAALETLRRALDSWTRYDDPYWYPPSPPPYCYYYGPRWYCW